MRCRSALALTATLVVACGGGSGAQDDKGGWVATPIPDGGSTTGDHDAGHTDTGTPGNPGSDAGTTVPPSDAGSPVEASTGYDSGTGTLPPGFVFSPYKDTSINMNWNTNVISTMVPGAATGLAGDLLASGGKTVSLAFATGECGSENWGGVQGAAMATANVPILTQSGVRYILSTGGAAGSFTCGTDAGMTTFIERWASPDLLGVDFDIEAGQSPTVIQDLVSRIHTAHGAYPALRFSLTIATLANNDGASTAASLGASVPDSLNVYGDDVLAAVKTTFGSSWPAYLTVDLMTMDYGSPSSGVCVVAGGTCDMGQSAIQAAYNLHDKYGVPYANIELTPMIGQNDASSEQLTLANAADVGHFAIAQGLAGVHYWSYDRDTDCAAGSASPTCNSMGSGYAGAHGFLKAFLGSGLH